MKIIVYVIVAILIGVGGLYFGRNMLVESAVENGSSFALGVETDLGSASLEISGGTLELNDLEISNPDGFEADNFLVMNSIVLDVDEGSILDDDVVIDSFVIDGIELNFEQIAKESNIQSIISHIKNIDVKSSESGSQKFHIKKLSVKNISVEAIFSLLGQKGEKKFLVDDFTLKNIGGKSGVTIGELTAIIIKKITTKVVEAYHNPSTEQLLNQLSGQAGEALKEIKDNVEKKVEELGKSILGR